MRTALVLALLAAPAALPAQVIGGGTTAAPRLPAPPVRALGVSSADTSVTMEGEQRTQVHTVSRSREGVSSTLWRADGVEGSAESEFDVDLPRRYTVRLGPAQGEPVAVEVRRRGTRLALTGTHTAVVPIPRNTRWAIADPGMEEHLVPALRTLPLGTRGLPVAVFRPSANRWDRLLASVTNLAGAALFLLQAEDGTAARFIVTDTGDLLYLESLAPGGETVTARRVPSAGSVRDQRLNDLLVLARSR